jgi:hypothetical protein
MKQNERFFVLKLISRTLEDFQLDIDARRITRHISIVIMALEGNAAT